MIKNDDIKLLFYSAKNDQYFTNLSKAVSETLTADQVLCFRNIEKFSVAVRDMLFGLGIIVIIARNKKELDEVCQIRSRLKDHSIILILDNSIDDLTHQALKLYPRYTSYIKDDHTDTYLVLEKMITNIQNKIKGGRNGDYQCH